MRRSAAFCFIVLGALVGCAVGSNEPANPGADPTPVAPLSSTDASLSPDVVALQETLDATAPDAAPDVNAVVGADAGPVDASIDAAADAALGCTGYATPSTPAACNACGSGSQTCDPNGCFNGYYCRLSDAKCIKKPASCP